MEGLEIERQGAALVATVERGDQNSFTSEMIDTLADAIDGAAGDGSTRFVRIRARGPVFCVSRDRAGTTPEELRAEAGRIVRINETLRTTPLVSIAEAQGDAAGFGCGIVGACDIAVASEEARFWFPEIRMGLAPTVVISWASKLLPPKRAFDMVVTGEPISFSTDLAEAKIPSRSRVNVVQDAALGAVEVEEAETELLRFAMAAPSATMGSCRTPTICPIVSCTSSVGVVPARAGMAPDKRATIITPNRSVRFPLVIFPPSAQA